MKSKSFDSASSSAVIKKDHNNSFDFIRLYKTAEETKASLQKFKNNADKEKNDDVNTSTPKQERSLNKRKKNKTAVEMSLINIECPLMEASGAGCNTPVNESKATTTSTPLAHREKVKSIMKTGTTARDDSMDDSRQEVISVSKPKKRNKSVSFMLEDNDELAIKKTKSDDIQQQPTSTKIKVNKKKKIRKDGQAEKENKVNSDNKVAIDHVQDKRDRRHKEKNNKKLLAEQPVESTSDTSSIRTETIPQEPIKKKRNKTKKIKKPDESESGTKTQTNQNMEKKKAKKKKHEPKSQTDTEEEPVSKSRKKEIKPELIAEDLENLSIGDNAHTLSSLLDEMTVTDNEKRKKLRKKASKSKKAKSKEVPEPQNTEDGAKEKKWKRKRWNKDRKAKETVEGLTAAVIVDNLPISMLFSYKKTLAELFAKYGLLRNVGIAEVYPTEVSKPVFTTTVYFDTEDAASKALAENGSTVEGSRISVSRPLPATQTTAVVRTYGALTEQALSTAFTSASTAVGRIRSIRIAVKGKKTMSTAFLEFDGPEAVERAIKMESEIKIGGKKIHVARFELRTKRKEEKSGDTMASDADHSDNNDTLN